jgi:tRNA threonylcarbamoyladenosine biosynthesis protein TsaB
MIIAINTATDSTELWLYGENGDLVQTDTWESGRQLSSQLLIHIEALLHAQKSTWKELHAIAVFRGPGSFTGLRIGISVANAIAYAQSIPIVGGVGDNWLKEGLERLANHASDQQVVPYYGAPANITKPRGTS